MSRRSAKSPRSRNTRTYRRSRSASSRSLLRWLGRVVAQPKEPEKPRKLRGPDILAGVLLLALGAGSIVSGIAMRSQLGAGWWHLPEMGILVVVAGIVALRWGVSRSLAYFPPFGFSGDDEDFPTILWALPFFVFGMACCVVATLGLDSASGDRPDSAGLGLLVAGMASIFLSVLIIIGIAIGRAAAALWRAFDRITGDPENHP